MHIMKWAIRDLLNPVVTRSLLYGSDPFDIEYILKKIDNIKAMSGRKIQAVWLDEWGRKIARYTELLNKAENTGRKTAAREYAKFIAQCYYACYMINTQDIDVKLNIYNNLENAYRKYTQYCDNRIEYVEINTESGKLPAYLHFPKGEVKGKYPCVITYSGLGSCKEELEMLSAPLIERGIAVLCPDMPGAGAAVLHNGIKCSGENLENAFDCIYEFLDSRDDIDTERIANYGLCMGGGYAFRATVKHPETVCCACLFPLLMNFADQDSVPIWMKRGKWASVQFEVKKSFLDGMRKLEEGTITNDFLMVYSDDDNWMTSDASQKLYEKAIGYKEKIYIDEKPAYVSEETIMHAMPVGEQYHWVKHEAADFIAERLLK